jgi:hypothetical protein
MPEEYGRPGPETEHFEYSEVITRLLNFGA